MAKGVFKNSVAAFAFQIGSRGVSFLVFVALARFLGVEAIGNFVYILSLCSLLSLFVEFGTTQFLTKEVVAGSAALPATVMANIVALKGVQYLLGLTILLAVEYRTLVEDFQTINLMLGYVLFESLAQTGITVFNARKEFVRANTFTFFYETSRSLALLGAVFFSKSLIAVPFIYIFTAAVYGAVIFVFILRQEEAFGAFRAGLRFANLSLPFYYKKTWLFFASAIAYQLYFRVDVLLLKRLATPVQLGLYSTAYKFFEVFLFVPAILSGIIFPSVIALYQKGSKGELKQYTEELQTKAVALISFLILAVISFSHLIIAVFFGPAFSGAVPVMQLLFLTSFLYAFNFIYPVLYNSTGNEKYGLYVFLLGFALNFALNYFFLPVYGAQGAAVINFVSEGAVTVCYYGFLRRRGLNVVSRKALALLVYCVLLGGLRLLLTDAFSVLQLNLLLCAAYALVLLLFFRKDVNPHLLLNARR